MAVVVVAAGFLATAYLVRQYNAFESALSRAETFLADDRYQKSFAVLAPYADRSDARMDALLEKIAVPVSIFTSPDRVEVAYRFSLPDAEWIVLGTTPLTNMVLPLGHYKLRFGDSVFMDATNPGVTLNSAGREPRVIEIPKEAVPQDMVFIPGGKYRLGAWGFVDEIDLGSFLIDRHEVSNRDYRDFVDAGGYANESYWQELIDESQGKLTWPIIRNTFVDLTGNAGPAGWELGSYLPGEHALPVVGISWYEASAYLKFRNKVLPSAHHWLRATLGPMEWKYPFAPQLVPLSNVGSAALLPVDREANAEVNGACDLIGNAAEWTTLESQGAVAVIGSGFRDAAWSYNFPQPADSLQRADDTGFRGMRYTQNSVTDPLPAFSLFNDFTASVRRVSDEEFGGIAHSFEYRHGTVKAANVILVSETESENWIRREVLIPTGHDSDPMPVFLFLPRRHAPPYQSVIYMPPADSWTPGFKSDSIALENYQVDFVPRSGRVLVWPVYTGSHERYDDYHADPGPERTALALERNRRIRDEIGRVIDYLNDDPEFDGSKVALMGLSHGSILASFSLATEPRIQTAVLYSVGIAPPIPVFSNPQNDPNVFWARVRQPILIINGRYDPIRPHQFVLGPLLELLATPDDDKKAILYESGHWPLPRHAMMRDTNAWLDRHLGTTQLQAVVQ
jgi:formylglycine-generating enzyme required for sulfatase activity/dienelactone hydrolase